MLTQHQDDLYVLFKEIDGICRKYNIEYSVAGGTLIGAIRHRGFIPWDDDMDIYMTLKNWRKFMDVCLNGNALPENRVLECQEVNRGFHNPIARYTDITKTAIHKNQVLHDDKAGFVLDIFALDPLPNNKEALMQYNRDVLLFSDLMNGSLVFSYRFRENRFRFFYYRAKMFLFGRDKVLKQVEDKLTKYDEEECNYYAMRWGGVPLCFPKEMIGNCCVELNYEDTTAMSLNKPYDYLVYHYGDEWMYIPPVTEQQGHDAVFNTDIAYPYFKTEINKVLNKKKMNRKYRRRQDISMLSMDSWNDLKDLNFDIKRLSSEMELNADFREANEEIELARKNKDYQTLVEIFSDYIEIQNDRRAIGRFDFTGAYRYYSPVLINIKEEYFELVLISLFHTGRISQAKRFIDVYEYNKGNKTPFMEELDSHITMFRQATSAFSEKDYEKAVPLIDKLYELYPNCNSIIKLKINKYLKIEGIEGNRDKVKSLAQHGLSIFKDDADFEKYLLDTHFEDNKKETLIKYVSAWENTLNGYIRLDIRDTIEENLDVFFEYCREHLTEKVPSVEIHHSDRIEKYLTREIPPANDNMKEMDFLSLQMLNRLIVILPDNPRLYEQKFLVMHQIAQSCTNPEIKALREYDLILQLLLTRMDYKNKFEKNQFGEIETVVTKYYYKYYREINGSDFVTLTTAEKIACNEQEGYSAILDRLNAHMDALEKNSVEYLYCLNLKAETLYSMGYSEESAVLRKECIKMNSDPYLNNAMRRFFVTELDTIFRKFYYANNRYYIHRELEVKGLSREDACQKTIENKKRLTDFYKKQIDRVYPSVLEFINILVKVHALKEKEGKSLIRKLKIKEDTKFNLKIAKKIHTKIFGENIDLAFIDDEYLDDINSDITESKKDRFEETFN